MKIQLVHKYDDIVSLENLLEAWKEFIKGKSGKKDAQKIISSFETKSNKGLPLGNLTSQLLANVYMNELDQFVKHKLGARYYVRYADDFALLSENREWLENRIPIIKNFLEEKLKLELHPDKILIKTIASGVDFLGWVHFSDHRVLRTATKRRMTKCLGESPTSAAAASYFGLLRHGNGYKLTTKFLGPSLLC